MPTAPGLPSHFGGELKNMQLRNSGLPSATSDGTQQEEGQEATSHDGLRPTQSLRVAFQTTEPQHLWKSTRGATTRPTPHSEWISPCTGAPRLGAVGRSVVCEASLGLTDDGRPVSASASAVALQDRLPTRSHVGSHFVGSLHSSRS